MSNKKRLYLVDNIKGLLIVLVVFGHICELFIGHPFNKIMYCIIYTFHMPAFVFCSGLFARYSVRKIRHYIVIYLLFQTVYTLLAGRFLPGNTYLQYHTPYWALWYIFSLICWLLLLPIFDVNGAVKKLFVLLLAVAAALLAGFDKQIGYMLSLSRNIVYLPYFLAGYYVDFKHNRCMLADTVKRWYVLVPSLLVAVLSVVYVLNCYDKLDPKLYYGVFGYDLDGMTVMWRLAGYAAAAAYMVLIFRFMPYKRLPVLTALGKRSLNIFLLHIFAVKAVYIALTALKGKYSFSGEVLSLVLCVVILLVTGNGLVDRVMSCFLKCLDFSRYTARRDDKN